MQRLCRLILNKLGFLLLVVFITVNTSSAVAQNGIYDTIKTYAMVYDGDTIEAKTLLEIDFYARYTDANRANKAKWTRLRNAIIVTYPYAQRSGIILNEMNASLHDVKDKSDRKSYIKSREKELKKEFTDPLSDLSVYQGKVLMKLINRETGNNCYDIIKEYRGGFTARFYQTVAFFFSSNLKQPYNAQGEEREMETILKEVCQTYGLNYMAYRAM